RGCRRWASGHRSEIVGRPETRQQPADKLVTKTRRRYSHHLLLGQLRPDFRPVLTKVHSRHHAPRFALDCHAELFARDPLAVGHIPEKWPGGVAPRGKTLSLRDAHWLQVGFELVHAAILHR